MSSNEAILCFSCADQPGLISRISTFFYDQGCDIRDAAQFGDSDTGQFFARMHFALPAEASLQQLEKDFQVLVEQLGLSYTLSHLEQKLRTLIAVSRQDHCLNDLLHRWRSGLLHTDIIGVVSNHQDLQEMAAWYGLPFYYLPMGSDKAAQEAQLLALLSEHKVDLLVLARYMQILSDTACAALSGRCINIHHSFLPSFKGARPYHRAHARGVKLVGATAHFVTTDLDEGPIIEQDVVRVNHAASAQEFVDQGREVEARVLARAVRWFVEHRIMLNNNKTIVFQ